MATCANCVHFEACKNLYEIHGDKLSGDSCICDYFKNRLQFVALPFKFDKGASPFDKIAHEMYIYGVEGKRLAKILCGGFYVFYNEERLYTVVKNDVVSLVIARSPGEAILKIKNMVCEEAEQALKEREKE